MSDITFEAYHAQASNRGFDEVLPRSWAAGQVVAEHAHPFAVEALVVAGEMWLTVGPETRHLSPGDTFTLAAGEPHAERYGQEGATYWAARRNAPDSA